MQQITNLGFNTMHAGYKPEKVSQTTDTIITLVFNNNFQIQNKKNGINTTDEQLGI